jgi:protein-S-isoprenylcysteine O-methyltransferase Ste14
MGKISMQEPADIKQGERGFFPRILGDFDRWAALDFAERAFVTAMFAIFAGKMLLAYHQRPNIAIALLVVSEVLVLLLVLMRGRTQSISTSPLDWTLAFAGSVAPLLAVPALQNPIIQQQICVGLMLMGLCLQTSAKLILWKSFGIVAANRGVKIGGPYRFIRHPIYAGYVLTHIGFLLGFPSMRNAILYLVALVIQTARLMREERILLQDPAYRAYAARTRYRLIPGLY